MKIQAFASSECSVGKDRPTLNLDQTRFNSETVFYHANRADGWIKSYAVIKVHNNEAFKEAAIRLVVGDF